MTTSATLRTDLHALLDQALELADERNLARIHQILACMAEGAEIADFQLDVPEGLDHMPSLHRHLLTQNLLLVDAAGRC